MFSTAMLLPCIGNDAFSPGEGMCTGLELYGQPGDQGRLFVIQQRAPPAAGLQEQYASSMISWLQEASVQQVGGSCSKLMHSVQDLLCGSDFCSKQVLLLCSLDAVMRRDTELAGQQLLYMANGRRLASLCEHCQWPMLQVSYQLICSPSQSACPAWQRLLWHAMPC